MNHITLSKKHLGIRYSCMGRRHKKGSRIIPTKSVRLIGILQKGALSYRSLELGSGTNFGAENVYKKCCQPEKSSVNLIFTLYRSVLLKSFSTTQCHMNNHSQLYLLEGDALHRHRRFGVSEMCMDLYTQLRISPIILSRLSRFPSMSRYSFRVEEQLLYGRTLQKGL